MLRSLKPTVGILSVLLACSTSFGWGAKGHQIIAYIGAGTPDSGQPFWAANVDGFRALTTVPDRVWKGPKTKPDEAPTHWFQADAYVKDDNRDAIMQFPAAYDDAISKYTEKVVITNGTAPWRIRQFYAMAVQALRTGDMKSAVQYAAAMSHYVGDLSQPLHVSENYDGQLTGNDGIHSFFETTIITDEMAIRADVQKRTFALLKDANFKKQFSGSLMDTVLAEAERALAYRDAILKIDTAQGRGGPGQAALLEIAKDRMADGAATLSLILGRLWRDAGVTLNATPIPVTDPTWVKPDYSPAAIAKEVSLSSVHASLFDEDDCAL